MRKNFVIVVLFILWVWFATAYFMADKKIWDYSQKAVHAEQSLAQLKSTKVPQITSDKVYSTTDLGSGFSADTYEVSLGNYVVELKNPDGSRDIVLSTNKNSDGNMYSYPVPKSLSPDKKYLAVEMRACFECSGGTASMQAMRVVNLETLETLFLGEYKQFTWADESGKYTIR